MQTTNQNKKRKKLLWLIWIPILAIIWVGVALWSLGRGEVSEYSVDTGFEQVTSSDLIYQKTKDGKGIILTGYIGGAEEKEQGLSLEFPWQIDGLPVVELGEKFMQEHQTLERIRIPSSVKKIGQYAFQNCSKLEEAELSEGLEVIGNYAFSDTAIQELRLPSTLKYLYASSVRGIETIQIGEGSSALRVENGMLLQNTTGLVAFSPLKTGECVIPEQVKYIYANAFAYSKLTSVDVSRNVEKILTQSFYNAKHLKKVVLNEGIKQIGKYAFYGCSSLEEIRIPRSVKVIESEAFQGCSSLKSVTISGDCQVAEDAFDSGVSIQYYQ